MIPERPFKLMHAVVVIEYETAILTLSILMTLKRILKQQVVQCLEVGKFVKRWEWETKWVQILLGKNQTYIAGIPRTRRDK